MPGGVVGSDGRPASMLHRHPSAGVCRFEPHLNFSAFLRREIAGTPGEDETRWGLPHRHAADFVDLRARWRFKRLEEAAPSARFERQRARVPSRNAVPQTAAPPYIDFLREDLERDGRLHGDADRDG